MFKMVAYIAACLIILTHRPRTMPPWTNEMKYLVPLVAIGVLYRKHLLDKQIGNSSMEGTTDFKGVIESGPICMPMGGSAGSPLPPPTGKTVHIGTTSPNFNHNRL